MCDVDQTTSTEHLSQACRRLAFDAWQQRHEIVPEDPLLEPPIGRRRRIVASPDDEGGQMVTHLTPVASHPPPSSRCRYPHHYRQPERHTDPARHTPEKQQKQSSAHTCSSVLPIGRQFANPHA